MRRVIAGRRLTPPARPEPWERLALAVLVQAVKDTPHDREAVVWLRGPGNDLAEVLGWPVGALTNFDPARIDWRALRPWRRLVMLSGRRG
jgi:hypothetical protein